MADEKYVPTERDKAAAEISKEMGCPNQAEYILKFGLHKLDPARWMGICKEYEAFYRMCVEGGHPYDYYVPDYPDGTIF